MSSYYSIRETSLGWVGVLVSNIGVTRTTAPKNTEHEAFLDLRLALDAPRIDSNHPMVQGIFSRFQRYFRGDVIQFRDTIDLQGSEFQIKVWSATKLIPYGETRSYGWIANEINSSNASMAVGQALKANPLPIVIPCHRVIGKNGSILGYGGPHGTAMKSLLLSIESPVHVADSRILTGYFWVGRV